LVVDDIIARINLAVSFTLIVVPNPPASPGEHGSDGKEPGHLPGLEDAALRVNQRNAVAVELEPAREIGGIQHTASEDREPVDVAERRLA
jgi:hypothetical protein